ncbi:polyhydroxyalkanoate depolymerase [Amorphus orientalis]|uniref:Poly(3-hydroxybutyrate) depolymerase n=1 Tax=Amorphus orientalis TaxID=649198 RepID=A0AAE3VKD8_9HYPH|nr:polyhydroxyalkanoate depolymerase [Amorphus orientalis]MDQ0314004.1 poly(3-hydroxybutyrate) depolymerase [Amorphus orientalis]
MYYQLYELNHAAVSPFRAVADATRLYFKNPLNPLSHTLYGRSMAAAGEVFERMTRRYGKPEFGLTETTVGGVKVPVHVETVWERPFCRLLHFSRDLPRGRKADPKVLVVAPMSGHYATLLRGTVEALLPNHDVYITDWTDARMVPLADGQFDLDDYIDYVISLLHVLGGDTHVIAVCQPAVPVFAAVALMEEDQDAYAPRSMTLMGGPIDTQCNPTGVNDLAKQHDLDWFRRNVIMRVPFPLPGFMREVYPGFLQLTGFMSMNLDRHMSAHRDFFGHLVQGDGDSAEKHREFYDEYMAVMDLTAEFYLQTLDRVFINHHLPNGEFRHRGRLVKPETIRRTALMTVEGEKDDISGLKQTEAAHRLAKNLPEDKRAHYMQPGVGHYGVFNGSRFRSEICPRIRDFILSHDGPETATAPARPKPAAQQAAPAAAPKAAEAKAPEAEAKAPEAKAEPKVANAKGAETKPAEPAKPARAPQTAEPAKASNPATAAETPKPAPKAKQTSPAAAAKKPRAKKGLAAVRLEAPNGTADDLTRISGVGPRLAERLNALGIYHFSQLAALDAAAIAEIDKELAFPGRIQRDGWVDQAKALAGEMAAS